VKIAGMNGIVKAKRGGSLARCAGSFSKMLSGEKRYDRLHL